MSRIGPCVDNGLAPRGCSDLPLTAIIAGQTPGSPDVSADTLAIKAIFPENALEFIWFNVLITSNSILSITSESPTARIRVAAYNFLNGQATIRRSSNTVIDEPVSAVLLAT